MRLDLYSVQGERLCTIYDQNVNAGHLAVDWKPTGANGNRLASGIHPGDRPCRRQPDCTANRDLEMRQKVGGIRKDPAVAADIEREGEKLRCADLP